jgi:DNA-binding NarL/FixJ family response regulator
LASALTEAREKIMKPKLLFIDDDPEEIKAIKPLVSAEFEFEGRSWPFDGQIEHVVGDIPDIFVLDLYLPPAGGPAQEDISEAEMAVEQAIAERAGRRFAALYTNYEPKGGKRLLQQTMACLSIGRELLDRQWKAMGQSPKNGIELMRRLKELHPNVPIIFYSRKISPADVVDVMRAGAFDAIQKGSLTDERLRARLKSDIALFKSPAAGQARERREHFNVTLSSEG